MEKNNQASVQTSQPIIGYIEKILVRYHNKSEDIITRIKTSDGETLVNQQGTKIGLFYPRNWNVQNQAYTETNIAGENAGALSPEKYYTEGRLWIGVIGSQPEDYIEDIEIIYTSPNTPIMMELNKAAETGMVSTHTPGVSNTTHLSDSRRKREEYLAEFVEKQLQSSPEFKKAGNIVSDAKDDIPNLRRFLERSVYEDKFAYLSPEVSKRIKDFILRAMVKNYSKDRVIKYIRRIGGENATVQKANLIYRTETQVMKNKIREWSYSQIDPEGTMKYKWIGPTDDRTTSICKNIENRTRNGVDIETLKEIIHEEVQRAKAQGKLPKDYEVREYNPHFQCRHTFVRSF